ncbi:Mitochondrial large subunit ribosomal protein (Img2) family protein [Babesia bovis T2Bo]|uniref:Large ribosomal subunit protein mL49 n=1 Tax=Babesia bovis TaxID=5865 RepID=A7AMG2_BABBO|nr:Mitochondrial large subunit ribosomal protein (Img2) family protein [Babesia bovis T2Bo]EDO07746.1 Mitochondrial large subunit ribosomal protein (Img2) family protein [Babesia bovis T2Bo]|eukprot:XP_001611314.1 hypothetical protein [Babesia bovis T2Bo]
MILRRPFSTLQRELAKSIQSKIDAIPFHINRTASGNLAVFVKYRHNNNLAYTYVQKVKGNRKILKQELQVLLGNCRIMDTRNAFVIQGNYKNLIVKYLKSIGF